MHQPRKYTRLAIEFFVFTEKDEDVEWMKELEEVAPYASEYDDYVTEKGEVLRDQGDAMPFTKGFYMIGQLVLSFNPKYARLLLTVSAISTQWMDLFH